MHEGKASIKPEQGSDLWTLARQNLPLWAFA